MVRIPTVTVSLAPYTGVGGPGTINMVLSYGGNAAVSPFTANYNNAPVNQFQFGLASGKSGSITVNLIESNGSTVSFLPNVEDNFFVSFNNATCTGIASSSCIAEQVAATPGATISGTVIGTFDATPVISAVISASSYGGFSRGGAVDMDGNLRRKSRQRYLSDLGGYGFQGQSSAYHSRKHHGHYRRPARIHRLREP